MNASSVHTNVACMVVVQTALGVTRASATMDIIMRGLHTRALVRNKKQLVFATMLNHFTLETQDNNLQ